ncbi:hypothetical protein GCM10007315_31270 [Gemmobacter tilapiae]|uniref:Uncharacterized protein n=1 Tax=Neogemmobacter tilapiae TaxID=875041 RepID=A0A918TYF0_9RHOB|nr:hypothetical protein GCM10007315_31270 [Gemmobacter tilapiae]
MQGGGHTGSTIDAARKPGQTVREIAAGIRRMQRIELDLTKLLGFRLTADSASEAAPSAKVGAKIGNKAGRKTTA